MALFPELGEIFLDERDRHLQSRMQDFYNEAITINQSYWGEADIDNRYYMGDQTLWNDVYGNLPAAQKKQFHFNRIKPLINSIDGFQRRNRKSTIAVPVEQSDQQTADQFTKLMFNIYRTANINETVSEAFSQSLVSGLNLLHVWVDYRRDPVSGDIKVDNCAYNSFLMDPYWRKQDLSDCNAIWRRSFLTKLECLSMFPDKKEEILEISSMGYTKDGKFQFMPETYNYGLKNLLTYDEFYYRDFRTQKILIDTQTGETQEWKSDDKERLNEFLSFYPEIIVTETEIPTVRLAITIQGKTMYDGPCPIGDCYPFVPIVSYYNPNMPYYPWRLQGVVRALRDPQFLYNRFVVTMADILESQVNSGWLFKENAVVNPEDLYFTGQGKNIAIKEEATLADVTKIPPGEISQSYMTLAQLFSDETTKVTGVNEELLGSAVDEKAGVLSMLRQGAGLTTLQRVFDQLDTSLKILGDIIINVIQDNFTPGKVKRMINEEPAAEFYNKNFSRYDAAVEEGFDTTTQKQLQFAQLIQLRSIGVPIPDESLIEAATIQDKNKLIELMQQNMQQQQQMQMATQQAQIQEAQARTQLAQARAIADEGLGIERMSRIQENQALAEERRAAAIKDEYSGLLDLIKSMKEIENIDIEQIEKLITMAHMVKEKEQAAQTPLDVAQQLQVPSSQGNVVRGQPLAGLNNLQFLQEGA